jgi:dCTP deaminase
VVLADLSLWKLLNDLVRDPDPDLVGPASIDVRVGPEMLREVGPGELQAVDLTAGPVDLAPGEFALVRTVEWLMVPNGYAVELKLKSSRVRQGFDPAMALWLDPGWYGAATLAIRNNTRFTPLALEYGMRIGELVVHQLDQPAVRPHDGRSEDPRLARGWASAAQRSLR